jgi:hypothetical protein
LQQTTLCDAKVQALCLCSLSAVYCGLNLVPGSTVTSHCYIVSACQLALIKYKAVNLPVARNVTVIFTRVGICTRNEHINLACDSRYLHDYACHINSSVALHTWYVEAIVVELALIQVPLQKLALAKIYDRTGAPGTKTIVPV